MTNSVPLAVRQEIIPVSHWAEDRAHKREVIAGEGDMRPTTSERSISEARRSAPRQNGTLGRRLLLAALGGGTLGSAASRTGAGGAFTKEPPNTHEVPRIREIAIPPFPNMHAIWGGTGRDDAGHLWFGVCAADDGHSAHLMELDPATSGMRDRGDVLSALEAAGRLRPREGQIKIHTKILQASDGHMYFASTDEEGEREDGGAPPRKDRAQNGR